MGATQFKHCGVEGSGDYLTFFEHHTSRSCERTFANVYLWSRISIGKCWYSKVRMRITYPLPTRPEHRKM